MSRAGWHVTTKSKLPSSLPVVSSTVSGDVDDVATILYVDDERAISRALNSWLAGRGHRVFTAASVADARAILDSNTVDGAFIDLWLGSENGLELFEWIDVNFPRVAQNTAFVTGDIIPDPAVQAALDHYARPVLVKPFELSELEGTVKAWRSP